MGQQPLLKQRPLRSLVGASPNEHIAPLPEGFDRLSSPVAEWASWDKGYWDDDTSRMWAVAELTEKLLLNGSPEQLYLRRELYDGLSNATKKLYRWVLDPPYRLMVMAYEKETYSGQLTQRVLKKFLKERGWRHKIVVGVLQELREFLRNLCQL